MGIKKGRKKLESFFIKHEEIANTIVMRLIDNKYDVEMNPVLDLGYEILVYEVKKI